MEEGLLPLIVAEIDADRGEARSPRRVDGGGEVGDLERHVVRARPVAIEESAQEGVVLRLPRLQDLDASAVGEAKLRGPEAHVQSAGAPTCRPTQRRSGARRRPTAPPPRRRGRAAPREWRASAQVAVRGGALSISGLVGSARCWRLSSVVVDSGPAACYAWGHGLPRSRRDRPGGAASGPARWPLATWWSTPWSASTRSTRR